MIQLYYKHTEEKLSVSAHQLLLKILDENYGIKNPNIQRSEFGKPYLVGGPFFSISHAGNTVLVAISDSEIGVDLEICRKISELVPARVLSESEYEWYIARGSDPMDFLRLWTLKECFLKYTGTGIQHYPNDLCFGYSDTWKLSGQNLNFYTYRDGKMLTAVCSGEHCEINRSFL